MHPIIPRMAATLAALVALAAPRDAAAQVTIAFVCSAQEEYCRELVTAYERTGAAKVAMVRKSTGEVFAQVKAEAGNPKIDLWWGGTGDPHLQAALEGLTEVYRSPVLPQLHDWAQKQAERSGYRTVGVYAGALGIVYNSELLPKRGIGGIKCWADLLDPKLKGEVQVADPNSSGTAYTMLATLVQIMGEDKAFDYMKKLHLNVNQYTKSGGAPVRAAALGETTAGIVFMSDALNTILTKAPIKSVAPCEGTGYEVGSMSLIKGAKNPEAAKKFYDWLLAPEAQAIGISVKSYQVPAHKTVSLPPDIAPLVDAKLIDYDFGKFGAPAERTRLLARWDKEVKAAPK
jgi:iron(III) transport system substrate-binding protein